MAQGCQAFGRRLARQRLADERTLDSRPHEPTLTVLHAMSSEHGSCHVASCVAQLDLGYNSLGAEDAKLLADALRVNGSLTRLDVSINYINEEGKAALRKAIEGRSGFELLL